MSDTKTRRMSRSPSGKSTAGMETCFHGGERGMGSKYSGTTSSKKSKPKMTRKSKPRAWGRTPDPMDFFTRGFDNL